MDFKPKKDYIKMVEQGLSRELTLEEQAERKEVLSTWHNEANTVYVVSGLGMLSPLEASFDARESFRLQDLLVDGVD